MSASTAPASSGSSSKQAELARSIADEVEGRIRTVMGDYEKARATTDAELATSVNSISARLELIENVLQSTKRPVKTERKTGGAGAKKAGGSKKSASDDDDISKVKNSMLYFRWAFAYDASVREEYLTPEANTVLEGEDFKNKTGADLYKAQGAALWRKHLSDDDKKNIKQRFADWDADRKRQTDEPQLDEDAVANGDETAADGADDGSPDEPAPSEAEPPAKPAAKAPAAKAGAKAPAAKAGAKAPAAKAGAAAAKSAGAGATKPAPKKAS